MKAAIIRSLAILFLLVVSLNLSGQPPLTEPNWDRVLALQTISKTETQTRLKPLYQMARSGRSPELLVSLSAIGQDSELSGPARDYLVFRFALGLSDLDANAVSPQVLDFLATYEVRTLVAHEEHPAVAVPLFNVRAAAAGARNRWDRQLAAAYAQGLLGEPASQWITSYLAASPVARRGYVDALSFASPGQLRNLGWSALPLLDKKPELTLVTARAGMDSGDFELLLQSIEQGSGPDLPKVLQAASRKLTAEESARLLDHSLRMGSDTKAALAIAQLAPARLDDPNVREMLFNTLEDRNLGAAAALVLGASKDPEIQARLKATASMKDGLAQKRAELAIKTRRADPEAER